MRHATEGVVTAGSLVGTDIFIVRFVEERTEAGRTMSHRLRTFEAYLFGLHCAVANVLSAVRICVLMER